MPIITGRNPWTGMASQSSANAGDIYKAMLAAKARQAQVQYQQRLLDLRGKMWESQSNLNDAKTMAEHQKLLQSKTVADLANVVAASQANKNAVLNASVGNDPEVLGNAAALLREQNVAPQGGFNITRGDLANLLQGLGSSAMTGIAAQSPASAADMMQPRNVPEGGVAYNSLGDLVGIGQPKSDTDKLTSVAPGRNVIDKSGKVVYTAPDKDIKPVSVAAQHDLVVPDDSGGYRKVYSNTNMPPINWGNALPGIIKSYDTPDDVKSNLINAASSRILSGSSAVTDGDKQRVGQAIQQTVTQPTRQKGQRVTTAKGTFEWNGEGWDPVQQ